jgi:hypothetical protein
MTTRLLMDLLPEMGERDLCSVCVVTLSEDYVASLRKKRARVHDVRAYDSDVTTFICSDPDTLYYDKIVGPLGDFASTDSRYRVLGSGIDISGYPAGYGGEVFVSDDGLQWMADRLEGRWPRESVFMSWAELEAIVESMHDA